MKGIGVSTGIGIGRILHINEPSLTYTPRQVTDTAAEKDRFRDAVAEYCEITRRHADELKESVGSQEAEIMLGHISIIRDPFLQGEVDKGIDGGQCAEAALECICEGFLQIFSSARDELTRERAADVRDVRAGVMGILLGYGEVSLSDAPAGTILCVKELTLP